MAEMAMIYSGTGFLGLAIFLAIFKFVKDMGKENKKYRMVKYTFKK